MNKLETMEAMKEALKSAGLPAYGADVKPGKCTAPYAVVYDGGTTPDESSRGRRGHIHLRVMVLAPAGQDTKLLIMTKTARIALKNVPRIRDSGELTMLDTDEARAAIYQTLDYTLPTLT